MNKLFDVYMYDADTGEFEGIMRGVKESAWKATADNLHFDRGYDIKVVDRFDGSVVYVLTGE